MARRSQTRNKILELARGHLQQLGFHGFSFRTLAKALDIKSAAVHYHFPTKADLGVELVTLVRREFQRWAVEVDGRHPGALERLDAFYRLHESFVEDGVLSSFGALEAEYATLPARMRAEIRVLGAELHGWIARTLRQGVAEGTLAFPGDADEQAMVVGATVQGALRFAMAFGPDRYRQAVEQLGRLMKASP